MNRTTLSIITAYIVSLALFAFGSHLHLPRAWAFGMSGYYPPLTGLLLFGLGGIVLVALRPWREPTETPLIPAPRAYFVIASLVTILAVALFVIFRTRTHFLGDGYSLIDLLAANDPLVKSREIGEAMAHIWVKNLIGGAPAEAALRSFRIISVTAGALYVAATFVAAAKLFDVLRDRLAFSAGMLTAGFGLLFFGYVENYSLFVLSVAGFVYIGLLIALGRINRWFVLLPLAAAILCHSLGIALVPSAVYLLLSGTKIGHRLAKAPVRTRVMVAFLLAVGSGVVIYQVTRDDYFVRLAFLPLFTDRFTVDNYALFSAAHLADCLNLLFLLLPGLLVILAALPFSPLRQDLRRPATIFLALASFSTLATVFVIDPKLGLARDWDLFSFALVPPAVLGIWLSLRHNPRHGRTAIWLAAVLGAFVLTFRLGIINDPPRAIASFKESVQRDHGRNRTSPRVLLDYYENRGDSLGGVLARRWWRELYPVRQSYDSAVEYFRVGQAQTALHMLRRIIAEYPNYSNAWATTCACFTFSRDTDSALYYCRVAHGMNPYDPTVLNNLAMVYSDLDRMDDALDLLQKAHDLEPTDLKILTNLAHFEKRVGRIDEYERLLRLAVQLPDAPSRVPLELTQYLVVYGRFAEAAGALALAVERGLAPDLTRKLLSQVPQMAPFVRGYPVLDSLLSSASDSLSGR